MLADLVAVLFAGFERQTIQNKMIMEVFRVKVAGYDYFVLVTPHPFCSLNADLMAKLRRHLAGLKALIPVVADITAKLAKSVLGCHHLFIGSMLGAVDAGNEHLLVGLVIVLCVPQGGIQIRIEILFQRGFVRIIQIA